MDAILTRMGAYDNMFSNSSTFKVELDEWYSAYFSSQANYTDTLQLQDYAGCNTEIVRDP